jgi:hypothetical protein
VDVLGDSGPAGTTSGVRPPSPNKPAMPAQYGVRANEQRLPGSATQKAARRSEEDTVGVLQPRTGDLTAKNRELVSQHHDLELLELTRTETQCGHRERTPKQQIHRRHEQEQTPSTRTRRARLYGRNVSCDAALATRRISAPHTELAGLPPPASRQHPRVRFLHRRDDLTSSLLCVVLHRVW